jgi:hypothetical protein
VVNTIKKVINIVSISNEQERNSFIITLCGISIISVVLISQYFFFLSYLNNNNIENELGISDNKNNINSLNNISLPTFIILLFGLVIVLIGIRSMFQLSVDKHLIYSNKINFQRQNNSFVYNLKKILENNLTLISSITYFILTSILSNTIIYRPFSSLSQTYQIEVPSLHIIGCCGLPGYFPVISIYFTDHFGLLLIPINLFLSSVISVLIGINVSLMVKKIHITILNNKKEKIRNCTINTKKSSTIIGLGAIIGLFVECPVCAGSFFIYVFGGNLATAGITTTFAIVTQPFFVIISFILLIIPPLLNRYDKL